MEYIFKGLRKSIHDGEPLRLTLANHLDLPEITSVTVEREALDARRKANVAYVYNLRFTVAANTPRLGALLAHGTVAPYTVAKLPPVRPTLMLPERPVIVGFGPAGMFASLLLAEMGYRPIVYERGEEVTARGRAIETLWTNGLLDPESNMQFGEGGAGTFSDGKLTTGKSSPLDRLILETFVEAGAPETILFRQKPHIGTDYLRHVVSRMRERVEAAGGEVHFGHKVTDLHVERGAVRALTVAGGRVATDCAILAVGHSARDTMRLLFDRGVAMQPKPFALGTRIEHPADFVNEAQYGPRNAQVLPPADYKLAHRYHGRGIYSFCMCPGGQVVCASSQAGGQVTNGMSRYARDGSRSNSALVVSLDPAADLGLRSPMDALAFLSQLEAQAFEAGGGGYVAPAQRAVDLLRGRPSGELPETSYRPGVRAARLDELLPSLVVPALRAGLARFDHAIPGFVAQGVLIGLESRTSSPLRILRDDDCQSVSTPGLYLLGEGAGYAGGIMTCARDAVRFARRVRPRDRA